MEQNGILRFKEVYIRLGKISRPGVNGEYNRPTPDMGAGHPHAENFPRPLRPCRFQGAATWRGQPVPFAPHACPLRADGGASGGRNPFFREPPGNPAPHHSAGMRRRRGASAGIVLCQALVRRPGGRLLREWINGFHAGELKLPEQPVHLALHAAQARIRAPA